MVDYQLVHEGRLYHFNSAVDKWVFETDPERYKGIMTAVDHFLAGHINPPDLGGALAWMGLNPGGIGKDAHDFAWIEEFRK